MPFYLISVNIFAWTDFIFVIHCRNVFKFVGVGEESDNRVVRHDGRPRLVGHFTDKLMQLFYNSVKFIYLIHY